MWKLSWIPLSQGMSLIFSNSSLEFPLKVLIQLPVILSDACDLLSPSLYLYLAKTCCFSCYNIPTILIVIARRILRHLKFQPLSACSELVMVNLCMPNFYLTAIIRQTGMATSGLRVRLTNNTKFDTCSLFTISFK